MRHFLSAGNNHIKDCYTYKITLVMSLVFVYPNISRSKRTFPSPDGFFSFLDGKKVGLYAQLFTL